MNSALHMVSIAKKAGRLEVGEEPVGAAARAKQAKIILLAADAADNSSRRAAHFAEQGNVPWIQTPFTKEELGGAVGRASCAMLAVTDVGLACAVASKLSAQDPERYGETACALEEKAWKAHQRQQEQQAHEKHGRKGKHKPWVDPKERPKVPMKPSEAAAPKVEMKRRFPRGIASIRRKKSP